MMDSLSTGIYWLSVAVFLSAALYGAFTDIKERIIPNWVSIVIAIALLPAALSSDTDLPDIAIRYGIGLFLLAICIALFTKGLIGGGDAKLLPACSVWMGATGIAGFVLLTAVIGGVLAVIFLIMQKRRKPEADPESKTPQGLPYGVAISLAAILMTALRPVLP